MYSAMMRSETTTATIAFWRIWELKLPETFRTSTFSAAKSVCNAAWSAFVSSAVRASVLIWKLVNPASTESPLPWTTAVPGTMRLDSARTSLDRK